MSKYLATEIHDPSKTPHCDTVGLWTDAGNPILVKVEGYATSYPHTEPGVKLSWYVLSGPRKGALREGLVVTTAEVVTLVRNMLGENVVPGSLFAGVYHKSPDEFTPLDSQQVIDAHNTARSLGWA